MPRGTKTATVSLSINPTSILKGEWSRLAAVITNTSSAKIRADIDFLATPPSGAVVFLGYNRINLTPGQQVLITTAYPTPTNAVAGTHVCEVRVSSGNAQLASDTEDLTVT